MQLNFQIITLFTLTITLTFLQSPPVQAHKITLDSARKSLMIPELQLAPTLIPLAGGGHLHLGTVNQIARPGGGRYTCGPLNQSTQTMALQKIQETLTQAGRFTRFQLDYVILCANLTAKDQPIGGIPVPPLNLIMLGINNASPDEIAHLFWHELYHFLEIKAGLYRDMDWNQKFSGYTERYDMSSKDLLKFGGGKAGFLNLYGQSFAHEERAEIAAWLLLKPGEVNRFAQQQQNAVLNEKLIYMQSRMKQLGL